MLVVVSFNHNLLLTYPHDLYFINPWRSCAVRVTVLGLCVSVSMSLPTTILELQGVRQRMRDKNSFSEISA